MLRACGLHRLLVLLCSLACCAARVLAGSPDASSSRLLIHIPGHASFAETQLKRFLHAALANAPVQPELHDQAFDVLLVLSGNASEFQRHRARGVLRGALGAYANGSSGFVELLPLANDVYDRTRATADWTAGPNAEFYDVMHERGGLFKQVTKNYGFVLQMEMDVCTFADGWLSKLMQPVTDGTPFIMSGARLRDGACVLDEASGVCSPVAEAPVFIQGHINGNALYRMDAALQRLLNTSLTAHAAWPFDIAAWLSAQDLGLSHLLHDNACFINVAGPIAEQPMRRHKRGQPAGFAAEVVFAHIPFRLRTSPLALALHALDASLPVTLTFVSSSHLLLFRNLLASLMAQRVTNVLVVAFDEPCFRELQRLVPAGYQVVANISKTQGSTQFKSSAFVALVNSRQAIIADVLRAGYGLLCLDTDVFVQRSYAAALLALPGDRTYFSSDGIAAHGYHFFSEAGPRYFFNAGVFFVPRNNTRAALYVLAAWMQQIELTGEADQDLLNKLVNCTALAACDFQSSKLRVGLLDPLLFQNGANFMARRWPSDTAGAAALVVHNNWANGFEVKRFRFQSARMWAPALNTACANVTALTGFDSALDGANAAQQLAVYLAFFAHVRARRFACAVVPDFSVRGVSRALSFDVLFDFHKVANFTGAALAPALEWVTASEAPQLWPAPQSATLPDALDALMLAPAFMSTFSWVHDAIGGSQTCVQDTERSAGQVAVTALRPGGLEAVLRGAASLRAEGDNRVLLAGKWRVLHERIDATAYGVFTSLSRRVFPPHERIVFGLSFAHGHHGEDVMFDVLDLLLCKAATTQRRLHAAAFPVWDAPTLVREVARHIPFAVLHEDMHHFSQRTPAQQEQLLGGRLLFSVGDTRNSGYSNRLGAVQTLLFLGMQHNFTAVLPPFHPFHTGSSTAPWEDVLDARALYGSFEHALPPSLLLLLQPSALFEYLLYGAQLPLVRHPAGALPALAKFAEATERIVRHSRANRWQSYSTLHVSPHAEELRLHGKLAVRPAMPWLGLNDEEAQAAFGLFSRAADVAMPATFRAAYFKRTMPHHMLFAQQWRNSFRPSASVAARSDAIVSALARPFACVHLRLLPEYLQSHGGQPHGNRTHVLLAFQQFADAQLANGTRAIYVAADTDIRPWARSAALPTALQARVHTCVDFGCPDNFGEEAQHGVVDARVCAAADVFTGNIYSSYTLLICAQRGDQACNDLFGRSITDDRLLL